jgi:acyl carrier protein
VLFRDEIENIYAAGGAIFIEFGPKNILTNLVGNILAGKPHHAVALNANAKKDSDRQLREAVMLLRVTGINLSNFDPYQAERKERTPRKKSPVTIKLNAGYYVTEKTRAKFQNALTDGFHISQAKPVAAPAASPAAVTAVSAPAQDFVPLTRNGTAVIENKTFIETSNPMNTMLPAAFETLLAEYQNHQSETLRLHEQYLRTEEEYAHAFAQLTTLQTELVSKGSGAAGELQAVLPLFESLERSMLRFHEHQAETLRVHQRYLENQDRFSQSFVQGVQEGQSYQPTSRPPAGAAVPAPYQPPVQQPVPAAPRIVEVPRTQVKTNGHQPVPSNGQAVYTPPAVAAPTVPAAVQAAAAPAAQVTAPAPAASGLSTEKLTSALLEIVSDKTGYPVETLELDMDMEADLGIDSIKRVEILGAMQTQFPELPKIDNTVLAELRTLGQIIDQMGGHIAAAPAQAVSAPAAPSVPAVAVSSAVQINAQALTQALLEIVSDKTGYPVETLELDMDMEADLGIDSIKRVEILGAMQTQFPELPKLRTLCWRNCARWAKSSARWTASQPHQVSQM